jgi:hypothetical protein
MRRIAQICTVEEVFVSRALQTQPHRPNEYEWAHRRAVWSALIPDRLQQAISIKMGSYPLYRQSCLEQ